MYTIVMDCNKTLTTTQKTSLYQGEKNVDEIMFLIPTKYRDLHLSDFDIVLIYVGNDNIVHTEKLIMSEKPYNDAMLCYSLPVGSKLTKDAGRLKIRIKISKNNHHILYTSETSITINPGTQCCNDTEPDIPDTPPDVSDDDEEFDGFEVVVF